MKPKIEVLKDEAALSPGGVADLVLAQALDAVAARGRCTFRPYRR